MTSDAALEVLDAQKPFDFKVWLTWIIGVGIWFLPLIWIDFSNYLVLTIAGLALGMLLFMVASGMTLIFGLMDVLNMAHGVFFAWGGYAGYHLLNKLEEMNMVTYATFGQSILSMVLAITIAVLVGGILGLILERLIIRQVYGDHLKQILITMGVLYVMGEVIIIFWGPNPEVVHMPNAFKGSIDLSEVILNILPESMGEGDFLYDFAFNLFVIIGKFRIFAIIVGFLVYFSILLVLKKTKLGIVVRAGVENRENVETSGYNIIKIFTGVFIAGAALAGIGGIMWGLFQEQIYPQIGATTIIFAMMVVIIGGMGSVTGSFLGALMLGLSLNYVGFLVPKLAMGSNILIMAIILLLRPKGLMGQE